MASTSKREPRHEQLSEGNGGWVRYQSDVLAASAFVRFEDRDGRLVAVDLFIAAVEGGLDTGLLRALPLARIEAWANAGEMGASIRARLSLPGPDLRRAASYYATTFGRRAKATWVTRMLAAQKEDGDEPQPDLLDIAPPMRPVEMLDTDLYVLAPPVTRRDYGDSFYRAVSTRYAALALQTTNPVTVLADFNNVPLSTVQRWIREARLRGFLPPAQPGKRG